ncbi:F0F1 ATP synthase subunit gamma, partial [Helicobacter sp. UBA3407]|uniref:F0F1 ATP synthase subunit gamma n=1 Tax=Helicobacter sp. UBA3407 TaxID=1946588 RepID=UPI0026145A24
MNQNHFGSNTVKIICYRLIDKFCCLCGGFNINTIKEVNRIIAEHKVKNMKVRLRVIGKKAVEYYKFNEIEVLDSVVGLSATPQYAQAAEFINKAVADYLNGITSKVILVHNG